MALPPTTVLGGYVVQDFLGAGAFSEVYRVATPAGGIFALKVSFGPNFPISVREASILRYLRDSKARHALLYIEDFALPDPAGKGDFHCLVVEYLRGFTLADVIDRRLGAEQGLAPKLLAEMARGLDELHALGVAHRDIKPENILFDIDRCRVFFIDFGLSCVESAELRTVCHHPVGSRLWMAPEIWHYGEALSDIADSMRADVWALGVVFHQLLHRGAFPYDVEVWGTLPNDPFRITQAKSADDPRLFHRPPLAAEARRFAPRPALALPPYFPPALLPPVKERDAAFSFADRRSGAGGAHFDRVPGGPPLVQSGTYLANRADQYVLPFDARVEVFPSRTFPRAQAIITAMLAADPLDRLTSIALEAAFAKVPSLAPPDCTALRAFGGVRGDNPPPLPP